MSNARCLAEGVDVPSVNGVLFLNPTKSIIDIIQLIGCAIRKISNKEKGYILIPIILPSVCSEQKTFKNSDYKPILDILLALRAYNDEEDLRELLQNKVHFESIASSQTQENTEQTQIFFDFEQQIKSKVVHLESYVRGAYLTSWC